MRRIPWTIVAAVVGWWGLNGLISALHVLTVRASRGRPVTWQDVLPAEMTSAAVWVPCTLWLLWWVQRAPLERERWARPMLWLMFAVVVALVFRTGAMQALDHWLAFNETRPTLEVLLTASLRNVLTAFLIIGVAHALVYAQRSRERERQARQLQEQLTQARLDALAAQLNPHFLFNALNSIAEMVHHDADAADRMLVQLGALLRQSLASSRQQLTSLEDELAVIDAYIGIEQVRLGERLRFEREIDPDVLHAQVPRLMLQPLVENAVAHSVAHRETPSRVLVRAGCAGDALVLEVVDDGAGTQARPGFGLGLANTRDRLRCLYGDAQSLDIHTLPGGGTCVRVRLPRRATAAAP